MTWLENHLINGSVDKFKADIDRSPVVVKDLRFGDLN